jgi:hypothetical protein
MRIDLNNKFRQGFGQLYHGSQPKDPAWQITWADNDSNVVYVKTVINNDDDILPNAAELMHGLPVFIVGKSLASEGMQNRRGRGADQVGYTFYIQDIKPAGDGSLAITLDRNIRSKEGWLPESLKIDIDEKVGLTKGIIKVKNKFGQDVMADFSKSDEELAQMLQVTTEEAAESRKQIRGFLYGAHHFYQVFRRMEAGDRCSPGLDVDTVSGPVANDWSSKHMVASYQQHVLKVNAQMPPLTPAPQKDPVADVAPVQEEAPAGVEQDAEPVDFNENVVNPDAAQAHEGHEAHKPHDPVGEQAKQDEQKAQEVLPQDKKPTQEDAEEIVNQGLQKTKDKKEEIGRASCRERV